MILCLRESQLAFSSLLIINPLPHMAPLAVKNTEAELKFVDPTELLLSTLRIELIIFALISHPSRRWRLQGVKFLHVNHSTLTAAAELSAFPDTQAVIASALSSSKAVVQAPAIKRSSTPKFIRFQSRPIAIYEQALIL